MDDDKKGMEKRIERGGRKRERRKDREGRRRTERGRWRTAGKRVER